MGGVVDPKAYITQNLHKLDQVFIISSVFWKGWTSFVGLDSQEAKGPVPVTIGNDSLKTNG